MKTNQTVEDVRIYFRMNYGHMSIYHISDETILEVLDRSYIKDLSLELKMDCLYDYLLSQDLCDVVK